MMNLQNVISDYLSKPTDFVIQIVGNWGTGKTYYYEHILDPLICKKQTDSDASKTYKPVYISLFGLKSVEEIATKIVMDFYQQKYFRKYFSRKKLKITQGILKIGLRGFLNFNSLGNINEYLTDVKDVGKNVLDTSELIICFDDLERRSTALQIEDIIGYINSLVDEGIKVLIISNDDLLLKNSNTYKNLKEKIIGISVEFVPNVKEILESIIELRYSSCPAYSSYLSENINDLESFSKSIDNNFRHVIYALDCLHNCYSEIKAEIIDCKNDISEKLQIELKNISSLILAWAVEYKSSLLKHDDISEFSTNSFFFNLVNDQDKKEKTKFDIFLEKYQIDKEKYRMYESLFNYVTAFDDFNTTLFITEFKRNFNLEKGKILPQYELLNSLSFQNFYNLSDKEYRSKTLSLIDYAEKGLFAPHEYLTIMIFSERLGNFLKLNLEDVKCRLLEGLQKSIQQQSITNGYTSSDFEMSGRMGNLSDINKQLYEEGMKEFKNFNEKKEKEKIQSIANLLVHNISDIENKCKTDSTFKSNLYHYSFLNYINIEDFVNSIIMADNETILFIETLFEGRYKNSEQFKDELDNLKKITNLLSEYREKLNQEVDNNIRKYVVNKFVESLFKIIREKGTLSA